jgi:hypothetical protein
MSLYLHTQLKKPVKLLNIRRSQNLVSVIDKILGWFSGSKNDKEPEEDKVHVTAREEEQPDEFSSEYDEYVTPDEHVEEEEQAPEFPRAH